MSNDKSDIVILPSKTSVEFRTISLADENYMASAKKKKSRKGGDLDNALRNILSRCSVRVVDPGPYTFLEEDGPPDWKKMISGDRISSMFALRKLSYTDGHLYVVENVTCACNNVWDHEFDTDEDLDRFSLSEESFEIIKSNQPFQTEVAGKVVHFWLRNGDTEEAFEKIKNQKPGREMAAGLRSRIADVDGLDRRQILDWLDGNNGNSKDFEGLSSDNAEELRAAFDAVDCGVDTEVEAACPSCGRFVRFDLPFDSIFLPGRKIREKKRARRGTAFSAR